MFKNKILPDYVYLAETSYSDFSSTNIHNINEVKKAIIKLDKNNKPTLPESFAKLVTNNYEVVAHYKDRDNDNESSFSATLFKGTVGDNAGKYVLAMKGTQERKDLLNTDLTDIVPDGSAHHQIADMYNFWQQITHTAGQPYVTKQLVVVEDLTKKLNDLKLFSTMTDINDIGVIDQINQEINELYNSAQKEGYIIDLGRGQILTVENKMSDEVYSDERKFGLGIQDISSLTVTGHSLGGHLSAAFARLFPEVVEHSYMINGAGFGRDTSVVPKYYGINVVKNIDNVFNKLNPNDQAFDANKITNIIGEGATVISNNWDWGLKQPGQIANLFIESKTSHTFGHGVAQMSDSMMVASLFFAMDSKLNTQDIQSALKVLNPIFQAAQSNDEQTLETIVHSLNKLFLNEQAPDPAKDRNELYIQIMDLHAILANEKSGQVTDHENGGKYRILSLIDNQDWQQLAYQDDSYAIAIRYALKNLNPFAIIGVNYDDLNHNSNHQLDLYSDEIPNGMTKMYIQKRIEMLNVLIKFNVTSNLENIIFYHDLESNQFLGNTLSNTALGSPFPMYADNAKVIFGTDKDDSDKLIGGSEDDYLFGGAGDDTLRGEKGNDYLEGGAGDDTLIGGLGMDRLYGLGDNDILIAGTSEHDQTDLSKNFLIGGLGSDHLYGSGGDDVLIAGIKANDQSNMDTNFLIGGKGIDALFGSGGNDFLIGGISQEEDDNQLDILKGGNGFDTYFVGNQDIVSDLDGQGQVYFNGENHLLTGGTLDTKKYPNEKVYISDDKQVEYRLNGTTLTVKQGDSTLTIQDYHKDQDSLGIRLNDKAGKDVVFVIDITGSMGDTIEVAKAQAKRLISKLFTNHQHENLDTHIGILTYRDNFISWLTKDADTPEKAYKAINQLGYVFGGTELVSAALLKSLNEFAWRKGEAVSKQIWLYGDEPGDDLHRLGEVFALSHNKKVALDGAKSGAFEYIPIHTISLNPIANASFQYISKNTKGIYLDGSQNLDTALNDIANLGTSGNDHITGTDGNNVIDGGAGDDVLSGGLGSDIYHQTGDFGHDVIAETNPNNQDHNQVNFGDASIQDYTFSNIGGNLGISNNGNSVTIDDFYGSENKIDQFIFKDMVLDNAMAAFFGKQQHGKKPVYLHEGENFKTGLFGGEHFIVAGDNADIHGSGANDAVVMNGKNISIHTGLGADKVYINGSGSIHSEAGSDEYVVGTQFGHVNIHNGIGVSDKLKFTHLNASDVYLHQSGQDLLISSLKNPDSVITLEKNASLIHRMETIEFADGSTLSHQNLQSALNIYQHYSYDQLAHHSDLANHIMNQLHQQNVLG